MRVGSIYNASALCGVQKFCFRSQVAPAHRDLRLNLPRVLNLREVGGWLATRGLRADTWVGPYDLVILRAAQSYFSDCPTDYSSPFFSITGKNQVS